MPASNIETIVNLSKRRGFVYPASEIYGGLGSAWDYGPLGVELANNIKQNWWKWMVHDRDDIEGIDSSIIQNRLVWKYCGHEETFNDMLTDCRTCKKRFRADKLEDSQCEMKPSKHPGEAEQCDLTEPRPFLTMLSTRLGAVADDEDYAAMAYLRPETAQGIFINFGNILTTSRRKLPFGIAQVGKAFRNEITPGNFILRTREFEQMEMEYFCRPESAPEFFEEWVENYMSWLTGLGISKENLYLYEVPADDLAHYSARTIDIMYRYFPEREDENKQWDELMGIANRTDFDTRAHSKKAVDEDGNPINPDSTDDLSYFDPHTQERFYPYVIEPAIGVNRMLLAVMMDAYTEKETDRGETRVILQLTKELAPIKAAILPLKKNHEGIVEMAHRIRKDLSGTIRSVYDDTGSIGKLYARQDEVGTPFCITVDFDSLEDQTVTVRDRDTWDQERVNADRLKEFLSDRLKV
ncbi:MAG: glycine--tRNA ligase [Aridibacter famidurans]|nr:glycine--tRNA ligase [Aridibacter famidurans]